LNKVIIFHPGLQHFQQLALALYEASFLQKFIAGMPVKADETEWVLLPNKERKGVALNTTQILTSMAS
jgi:hypothetical protein